MAVHQVCENKQINIRVILTNHLLPLTILVINDFDYSKRSNSILKDKSLPILIESRGICTEQ